MFARAQVAVATALLSTCAFAGPEPGVTLYSINNSTDTHLIDLNGNIVQT